MGVISRLISNLPLVFFFRIESDDIEAMHWYVDATLFSAELKEGKYEDEHNHQGLACCL